MLKNKPFWTVSDVDFDDYALAMFQYQAQSNKVYAEFIKHLNIRIKDIKNVAEIPFLPIQFFKSHDVISGHFRAEQTFYSSGTTGLARSRHLVKDISVYQESFIRAFTRCYGPVESYTILALLPSYLEQKGSSLVFMVNALIERTGKPESGFYLEDIDQLNEMLLELDSRGENVLLLGVSYALLDLVETYQYNLENTIVMETGGMKGRRRELIRDELHAILCKGFGVSAIHSEYGMTELLSQASSIGNGVFECPPWMRVCVRDTEDAMTLLPTGKSGGLNIIDLANVNSCSFIATQDLGKVHSDGSFEVLGRFDNSDIRGCNLMVF